MNTTVIRFPWRSADATRFVQAWEDRRPIEHGGRSCMVVRRVLDSRDATMVFDVVWLTAVDGDALERDNANELTRLRAAYAALVDACEQGPAQRAIEVALERDNAKDILCSGFGLSGSGSLTEAALAATVMLTRYTRALDSLQQQHSALIAEARTVRERFTELVAATGCPSHKVPVAHVWEMRNHLEGPAQRAIDTLNEVAEELGCEPDEVPEKVETLQRAAKQTAEQRSGLTRRKIETATGAQLDGIGFVLGRFRRTRTFNSPGPDVQEYDAEYRARLLARWDEKHPPRSED